MGRAVLFRGQTETRFVFGLGSTMSMELIRGALGWCTLINWGLLLWWWLFIAFFKIAIFLFNLVPYLALRIVG